jgi:hypothetical protein
MKTIASILTIASLASAPATAGVRDAAFAFSSDRAPAHTSMFVGATYRVGVDRTVGKAKGRASLRIAGMAMTPGSADVRFAQGLELTAGRAGKPALHIAGQDIGQIKRKANLGTGGAIAIGVGVVLLVGVAVLAATEPWECYDEDQQSRCD